MTAHTQPAFSNQGSAQHAAAHFAQTHLSPNAARWAQGAFDHKALFAAAGKAGLLGMRLPVQHGGLDLSFGEQSKVLHALAGADFGAAMALVNSHNVAVQLVQCAPNGLAPSYLTDLISGQAVACTALTEPGVGSDLAQLQTQATRRGGGWVLNGCKTWIINAAFADGVVVYAQTQPGTGVKGLAAFYVGAGAEGFERIHQASSTALSSMGVGGLLLANVFCDDAHMLCGPGEAFADIMASINKARTYVAAMCCGMVAQALVEVRAYGGQRRAFGKTLMQHQGWRWQLGQAATALQAGELMVAQACNLIDQGAEAQVAAAQAKMYATNMAQVQLGVLLQAMGAEGLSDRYPFSRHLIAAHAAALTDGSTAMLVERVAQDFR